MKPHPRTDRLIPVAFRYYMAANLMRQFFQSYLRDPKDARSHHDPMLFLVSKAGLCMRFWYGGLYAVIEAWQELGLADPAIDALLLSPNTKLLKRCRNAAFHSQNKWLHEKESDFYGSKDAVPWVLSLTKAFGTRLTSEMKRITAESNARAAARGA